MGGRLQANPELGAFRIHAADARSKLKRLHPGFQD
jgi:hypothetical protein